MNEKTERVLGVIASLVFLLISTLVAFQCENSERKAAQRVRDSYNLGYSNGYADGLKAGVGE